MKEHVAKLIWIFYLLSYDLPRGSQKKNCFSRLLSYTFLILLKHTYFTLMCLCVQTIKTSHPISSNSRLIKTQRNIKQKNHWVQANECTLAILNSDIKNRCYLVKKEMFWIVFQIPLAVHYTFMISNTKTIFSLILSFVLFCVHLYSFYSLFVFSSN